jgi:Protein of unknown function (DUF2877)
LNSRSGSPGALSTEQGTSTLEASWVGSAARSRLKAGSEGTIHGVFDGAVNMLFDGGLVSLVPEALERGPLNVTLRPRAGLGKMSSIGVEVGDRARVRLSTLKLGGRLDISFRSAGTYAPSRKFALPMLEDRKITANLEVAKATALLHGKMAGLGELVGLLRPAGGMRMSGRLNIFASAALPRMVRLERAFRSEDESMLKDAVRELIGLGPGLTPSSDDMLAGLVLLSVLFAENRGWPRRASRLVARAASGEARGRTTILSEEYLVQASLGRGNERVMKLCAELLTGERRSVERETRRVLSTGETSGTDTVLGMLLGATLCMDRRSGLARRRS